MPAAAHALSGGFVDPVMDAQATFRVLLDAMASPARIFPLQTAANPPSPLCAMAAAVALTLCDQETPVWFDEALGAGPLVRSWLEFHTGAPVTSEAENAAFAFLSAGGNVAFDLFAQGVQEYPDRSTTLVVEVGALGAGREMHFEGPGIKGRARLAVSGLPRNFETEWSANRARFPRGVDLVLVSPQGIACLPRTARLVAMEA